MFLLMLTLPICLARPDPEFLEQLDQYLYAIIPNLVPKCLQGLHFFDPNYEELDTIPISMSYSDNNTDEEHYSPL
jgi:hypothetical protein